jgi:hypothetical protein
MAAVVHAQAVREISKRGPSAIMLAAPAAVARDAYPCGPRFSLASVGYVQYCPDWSPNNWIPVHQYARVSAPVVGSIYASRGGSNFEPDARLSSICERF